jgi:hypothetical protein
MERPSGHVRLFIRKVKGDQRRDEANKPVMAIPIAANPLLANLLEWYMAQRTAFCTANLNNPPPGVWSFSPHEASAECQVVATLHVWLDQAYMSLGAPPPAGFKWTSPILRKGATSASRCIGAPLPVVKYMGGWAKNNSVTEGRYIDPTMTPSLAA